MRGSTAPLTVRLDGLRVAISAGAAGIGRVMADSFAACGARVFLCDVDREALDACPHPSVFADVETPEGCDAFMGAALDHLGGLDVLLNNAGIAGPTARGCRAPPPARSSCGRPCPRRG